MTRTEPIADAIPAVHGTADDFDFFVGNWNVRMRRLRAILHGSTEWYDLTATCSMRKIVGGLANVDDFHMTVDGADVFAATLRLFDPAARRWSIFWVSSARMVLEPPVVGGFENGDGLFYGPDTYDGRPISGALPLADFDRALSGEAPDEVNGRGGSE